MQLKYNVQMVSEYSLPWAFHSCKASPSALQFLFWGQHASFKMLPLQLFYYNVELALFSLEEKYIKKHYRKDDLELLSTIKKKVESEIQAINCSFLDFL